MSGVSTHVLDAAKGIPAAGVPVVLASETGDVLTSATTNSDGRAADLLPTGSAPGTYRLTFDTGAYFAATATDGFYPEVSITFVVTDPSVHHHVPLLLSPFAYSTYKGS